MPEVNGFIEVRDNDEDRRIIAVRNIEWVKDTAPDYCTIKTSSDVFDVYHTFEELLKLIAEAQNEK